MMVMITLSMKILRHTLLFLLLLLSACNFPGRGDTVISDQPAPTLEQKHQEPTLEPATATPEPKPAYSPPEGFRDYSDELAKVTASLPESWVVTGIVEGGYAIFQSYPMDKYVGGEGFQPGDTKCDLNLQLESDNPEEILQQWTSDGLSEIVSRQDLILASGYPGLRIEMEGWGGSLTMFVVLDGRLVSLTCYGAFEYFDQIAGSIRPLE